MPSVLRLSSPRVHRLIYKDVVEILLTSISKICTLNKYLNLNLPKSAWEGPIFTVWI